MRNRMEEWDYLHKENCLGALSGCTYQETVDFLKLKDFMEPSNTVLEIGVGMGYVTGELYDRGYNVSVFDISPVALNRVRKICTNVYDLSNIETIPANVFDLIICHNVVQHIPTPILYYELFHFLRSLHSNGVMAIKSVSTQKMEDTGDHPELVVDGIKCASSIGCFCRSIPYFTKIVDRCGGLAKIVYQEDIKVDFIDNQHVFHVTKKVIL
jgi:SAM-dependent methyltransferase